MKRPQFSLRTLLIFITAGTVFCWAYWIGWPRWQLYQEQVRFLDAAKKFKPGMSWRNVNSLIPSQSNGGSQMGIQEFQDQILNMYSWPNVTYYILFHHDHQADGRIGNVLKIEVFRAPPLPLEQREYLLNPKTEYMREFFLMIGGDRKDSRGFQYELIYSDPPRTDSKEGNIQ